MPTKPCDYRVKVYDLISYLCIANIQIDIPLINTRELTSLLLFLI